MIGAEKQREKRALARLLKALHKELSEVEADVAKRFEVYRAQMMDLQEASMRFTEGLRDIYPIRTRVDANALCGAHVSMGARTAARHEAVGVSTRQNAGVRGALVVSSERRGRPPNHEGVLTYARGPPGFPINRKPDHPCFSAPARLGKPARARNEKGRPDPERPLQFKLTTRSGRRATRSWLSHRILRVFHGAFEDRVRLDRQRGVEDVATDLGARAQLDLAGADTALDGAAHNN